MNDVSIEEQLSTIEVRETIQTNTSDDTEKFIVIDNGSDISSVVVVTPNYMTVEETVTLPIEITDEAVTITEVGLQGLPGADGQDGTGSTVNTTPVQAPNGARTSFTTPSAYAAGTLQVFLNGLLEGYITETSSTTFTFDEAPYTGDVIRLIYKTN